MKKSLIVYEEDRKENMIQIYHQFDRSAIARIMGAVLLIWALVMAYARMAMYPAIPKPTFSGTEKIEAEDEVVVRSFEPMMKKITQNQLCVPEMSAAAPSLPVNQEAYNWMAEFQPDLIGVPHTGTPFRATLGRSMKPLEMQDLSDVIEAGADPKYRGRIVVYYSNREPSGTTVVAKIDQLDEQRQWIMACDPTTENCDNMGITIFTSKGVAEYLPPITCAEANR
jgi:hypothetical protein